ncbi:hypothetical protein GDO78_022043 [Eleutherodactylus coqui]|uniref:Uncharacterized protein n=1 Tax=Eleutherodactylus coqui TaxID=57060 RepID=A0A8J6JS24_ELECQ|nr:hypothetical protein GDO78_022043 [Eleutherodactylus coqui]
MQIPHMCSIKLCVHNVTWNVCSGTESRESEHRELYWMNWFCFFRQLLLPVQLTQPETARQTKRQTASKLRDGWGQTASTLKIKGSGEQKQSLQKEKTDQETASQKRLPEVRGSYRLAEEQKKVKQDKREKRGSQKL